MAAVLNRAWMRWWWGCRCLPSMPAEPSFALFELSVWVLSTYWFWCCLRPFNVCSLGSYRFWCCPRPFTFCSLGSYRFWCCLRPFTFCSLGSYRFWRCLRHFVFCSLGSYVFWCCFHAFNFWGVIGFSVVYVSPFIFWEFIGPAVVYTPSPFGELSVLALLTSLHPLESYRSWRCLRPFTVC